MAIGDLTAVSDDTDCYYVDVGAFDVPGYGSVYLLDAERPAVVDTGLGTNVDRVVGALDELGIDALDTILTTHVHLDHAGGAGHLLDHYPDATVLSHDIGVPHLIDPSKLVAGTKAAVAEQWKYYVDPKPVPEDRIEGIEGGDTVDLGDHRLDVVHAPGHAPHQVMFHDRTDDVLFTGDAAGIRPPAEESLFPTSPPVNFDLETCLDDAATVADRNPETICFGHFGDAAFSPDLMDEYGDILTDWVEQVREKRGELGDDDAVIEHFAETAEPIEPWGERKTKAEHRLNVRGALGYLDHIGRK
ncbi:MBL fold metallo-hydrolase [Haloplanus halobius]|uniref:MBL fold metallo-hydrolase n=1 Tax=Haloplanus halobius TaxID=2934938 RepID=UPI00200F3F28|nr:MBL fold metallo-hydrolase [Haloplanus sp. XH21]